MLYFFCFSVDGVQPTGQRMNNMMMVGGQKSRSTQLKRQQ